MEFHVQKRKKRYICEYDFIYIIELVNEFLKHRSPLMNSVNII